VSPRSPRFRGPAPVRGAWNQVQVPPASLAAGTRYWIAILGPGGALAFRDRCCSVASDGPTETSAQTDLAVLPQIVQRKGYLLNVASLAAASHAPLMGPYTASKAGVEALTDTLRVELSTTGARAGCAYFGFIDTDLVRASFAQSSTQTLQANMPAFIRTPVPVGKAVDAIERAVDKRLARTWAPRFVGGFLALRGILQPLAEKRLMGSPELAAAIAEADAAGRSEGDLGVAGQLVS